MVKLGIMIVFTTLILAGCTTTQKYAGGGAAAGAGIGAIIGNQSGNRDKGVLIGAIVGGLAGTVVGQNQELNEAAQPGGAGQNIVLCPSCNTQVDVTSFPARSTVACPNCRAQFTF